MAKTITADQSLDALSAVTYSMEALRSGGCTRQIPGGARFPLTLNPFGSFTIPAAIFNA
jgi:hypothetical protein